MLSQPPTLDDAHSLDDREQMIIGYFRAIRVVDALDKWILVRFT